MAAGASVGADGFAFKDPSRKQGMTFALLPVGKMDVVSHQRRASDPLVKRIVASIQKVGFVAPVIAVERGGTFHIIDGQHRYLAAKELGLKSLPVVVVPERLAHRMLSLNVEREPNIRERSYVALAVYREIVETRPKLHEDDEEIVDAVENAHYVTLGIAYESSGRLAGSSMEPILKRCDAFLDRPMPDAYEIRGERGALVVEADKLVKAVTAKLKETGAWHEFVGAQIVAYANPLKRTRKQATFDDTFAKLIAKLRDLEADPGKLARGG
jgi:ParB family chromosome partitioning protein